MSLVLCCAASEAGAEPFIGQFELKNLESERGAFEFQSQNARMWGQPPRRLVEGPDGVVLDENSVTRGRYALELEMGFTRTVKMRFGVEFEEERFEEADSILQANAFDDLTLSEIGAEIIVVLAPREGDGGGFGLVAEIETPVDRDESSALSLGPILEFRSGRWFAAAIPMVVYAFGGEAEPGERIDNKWDFAYATQLAYTFSERWSLALEGYGTVERLGRTGHPSESARMFGDFNQHRVGPVVYYARPFGGSGAGDSDEGGDDRATLTIGLGFLQGLNRHTAEHTLKLSIEIDF